MASRMAGQIMKMTLNSRNAFKIMTIRRAVFAWKREMGEADSMKLRQIPILDFKGCVLVRIGLVGELLKLFLELAENTRDKRPLVTSICQRPTRTVKGYLNASKWTTCPFEPVKLFLFERDKEYLSSNEVWVITHALDDIAIRAALHSTKDYVRLVLFEEEHFMRNIIV